MSESTKEKLSKFPIIDKSEIVRKFATGLIYGEIQLDLYVKDGSGIRSSAYERLEELVIVYLNDEKSFEEREKAEKELYPMIVKLRANNRIINMQSNSDMQKKYEELKNGVDLLERKLESTHSLIEKIYKVFPKGKDLDP